MGVCLMKLLRGVCHSPGHILLKSLYQIALESHEDDDGRITKLFGDLTSEAD